MLKWHPKQRFLRVLFSQNLTPINEDFHKILHQKSDKILEKISDYLKMAVLDTQTLIPEFPFQSKNQPLFPVFLVIHANSIYAWLPPSPGTFLSGLKVNFDSCAHHTGFGYTFLCICLCLLREPSHDMSHIKKKKILSTNMIQNLKRIESLRFISVGHQVEGIKIGSIVGYS